MSTYKWHEVYKDALLETDWSRMEERIQAALAAIQNRKHEFAMNHGGTPEESQAMTDAIKSLSVLRTELESWSSHQSQKEEAH